ncbi:MAG: molybdopterin cofactor-binding domain-containing protein [bacterium]|nr:molybdopterin cofactor-binding domain-containing protein [bacterium]
MAKDQTVIIGKTIKRIDAQGKVTGVTPYPSDIDRDGQLWMKILWSERPHAKITRVDTHKAQALAGVVAVYTAQDVPNNTYGLIYKDQPVLCGLGSNNPHADVVRCYMDNIAIVIAETEAIASQAIKLIEVDYDDLPAVYDMETAMNDDAPRLHAENPNNILCHFPIRKGDIEAGFADADVIVEGMYETGYQEHAYLQPEAGLSYIDDEGRVTVVVAGQWVHEDLWQITHTLNLPEDQVRVIYPAIGGAFGGREDMSVQILLALATWKLQRPIKIIWSREESIKYHHKRHPMRLWAKWGATYDGKITAIQARVVGDVGAYAYTSNKVLANTALMVTGPYVVPHVSIDAYGVYTNNIPTGAFRGFGAPQAAFCAEGMMNKLADELQIDPVAMRLINSITEGSIGSVNTPFPKGVSMPKVIEACAKESFWTQNGSSWIKHPRNPAPSPHLRRGVGIACSFKNVGYSFGFPEHSWAQIEIYGTSTIEKVIVRASGADVGQGSHTAVVQMTAEAVGVPIERVQIHTHDTAGTQSSGSASASRLVFMAGNAIRGAAQLALQKWASEERPAIADFMYRPPPTTAYEPVTGKSTPNYAYGYVAQAVEVQVDIETGFIDILDVVSTHDVGKIINPQGLVGQVEGAVIQAQGYAVMENLISVEGKLKNPYFSTYLIPTALDIPHRIKPVLLEYPDPIGPWGARGMAEMPFLTIAPALAAAVYDATGVWLNKLPFTPDSVVKALRARGLGGI